ncbi:HAMP domain-containing histidine kinase [bacterium]|nr:HAMP domain-containing histidine kinase [bacterium]
MPIFPETPTFSTASMFRRNRWLISLRWYAILGLLLGVLLLKIFEIGSVPSILWMTILAVVLFILNLFYFTFVSGKVRRGKISLVSLLNLQMAMDLLLLTILIYLTGCEESPLAFFYVFHIILTSIIFPGGFSYLYSLFVVALYSGLLVLEHGGIVTHICFFQDVHIANTPGLAISVWFIVVVTMIATAYLAQNVTMRHRRVREKLEIANQKLKEINKTKTTFFRYASHEMKAPVATIQSTLMVIEDILGQDVDDRVKDMLQRAIGRTAGMILLLKDLADLTYSNFQEAQKFENLDLTMLLQDLISDAQPNIERKNQKLDFVPPAYSCEFFADPIALNKIFINLLSNAIRYTQDDGKIEISLKQKGSTYVVSVKDNGPGIPESEQANIFQEFYRTPAARKLISEGTGLGLPIVMRMIELHKGTINVFSKEGQGSEFVVILPIGGSL